MSYIKEQMASFLTNAAREGISRLDKGSSIAKELNGIDIESVMKEDINRICDAMTFSETVRIMSLGTQIKLGSGKTNQIKEDLKNMAKAIEVRVESRYGKLRIPPSCRDLLFNL
ncbi:MAG: hypothetical protein HQL12_06230 [Candidatus Omnitrophica bacterium]|nr:hypothetical protein [Candidatus Omnitrophota bacterium]